MYDSWVAYFRTEPPESLSNLTKSTKVLGSFDACDSQELRCVVLTS